MFLYSAIASFIQRWVHPFLYCLAYSVQSKSVVLKRPYMNKDLFWPTYILCQLIKHYWGNDEIIAARKVQTGNIQRSKYGIKMQYNSMNLLILPIDHNRDDLPRHCHEEYYMSRPQLIELLKHAISYLLTFWLDILIKSCQYNPKLLLEKYKVNKHCVCLIYIFHWM